MATTRVIVKDGIAGERAVERLKRLIFTGDLAPGEQLRQEDMAQRLAVSRPLVREERSAALATQGLIEHRPRQGFFVAKRAPIELAQIMLMLDLLAPELMRSMTQPSPAVLGRLEELNRRMEELIDEWDNFETLTLNREFHFLLFDESPTAWSSRRWSVSGSSPNRSSRRSCPHPRAGYSPSRSTATS